MAALRAQVRVGDRGRDKSEGYDRAASRLILQEKVDAIHGLISTGVSLGVAPVAGGTGAGGDVGRHHPGRRQEMMPNPKYVFRSTDNECER